MQLHLVFKDEYLNFGEQQDADWISAQGLSALGELAVIGCDQLLIAEWLFASVLAEAG